MPIECGYDARQSVGKHTRELTEALGSTFFDPGICSAFCSYLSLRCSVSRIVVGRTRCRGVQGLYYCVWLLFSKLFLSLLSQSENFAGDLWAVVTGFILVGAWYWDDCAQGFNYARDNGIVKKSSILRGRPFYVMTAVTLTIHFLVPCRWLSRMADDLSDNFQEVVADGLKRIRGEFLKAQGSGVDEALGCIAQPPESPLIHHQIIRVKCLTGFVETGIRRQVMAGSSAHKLNTRGCC